MIKNHYIRTTLLTALFLLTSGCAHHGQVQQQNGLNHIVMIWLKDAGNTKHRQAVISASEQLRKIAGIKALRIGEALPSDRPIVDDSFDIGIYMLFTDQAAMKTYTNHPAHKAIVKNQVMPLAKKIVIYDF